MSIVYVGPERSISRVERLNRGFDDIALETNDARSIALAVSVLPFCHGSPAGKKTTLAAHCCARTSSAARM